MTTTTPVLEIPPKLDQPSTVFRSTVARGLLAKENFQPVDRAGGKYTAGLIRGFAVITVGEALGHGMWIDDVFLGQVSEAINAEKLGVKSRFAHPELSGDGMGKMMAKTFGAEVVDERVYADNHFLKSSHRTPDGDLGGYVMDLAEEAPDAFGASIAFMPDYGAEMKFVAMHSDERGNFKSPDKRNTENYMHARLAELIAVDIVDEPAANPDGMFHRGSFDLLENGTAILDYAFGVTDQTPGVQFGVDPSRLKGFVARWAGDRGFELKVKEEIMPAPAVAPETTVPVVETAAESKVVETAVLAKPAEVKPEMFTAEQVAEREKLACQKAGDAALSAARDGLKQFTSLFGAENGSKWFQDGVSMEDAKDKHIAALTAANKDLATKVSAATGGLGEQVPLSGTSAPATSAEDEKRKQLELQLGPNIAKIAMAMKVPEPSRN